MSGVQATARPKRAKRHPPHAVREFINAEIGRMQTIEALLSAMKFAANHDHEFDVPRALAGVLTTVSQSLTALDAFEVRL